MNPVANTPIFLGLTSGLSLADRKTVAAKSTLLAFAVISVFCVAGHLLFEFFGIGLPSFRATGGILVFLVGKHLLEGRHTSPVQTSERAKALAESPTPADDPSGLAVSPLAIPILAGPGTIACAISFSSGRSPVHVAITVVGVAVLSWFTYLCFATGEKLMARMGPSALDVVSRLMGLILAVIGVQMLFEGLGGAFPHLFY
jgi:multiple antibiotic resistance protein